MRDQSDIMCFITFVTIHRSERASDALIPKWKVLLYGINSTF